VGPVDQKFPDAVGELEVVGHVKKVGREEKWKKRDECGKFN
jgi:hypothetical protein